MPTHKLPRLFIRNFSARSVIERKVLLQSLNAREKASIWREHLTRGFERYNLTYSEQSVLRSVIDALNTDLFALRQEEKVSALEDSVNATFRREIANSLFGLIGDPPTTACKLPSSGHSLFVKANYQAQDAIFSACNCSMGSSFNFSCYDVPNNGCGSARIGCLASDDGCGFLGLYSCNGGCLGDG